jgi:hypothetical protein
MRRARTLPSSLQCCVMLDLGSLDDSRREQRARATHYVRCGTQAYAAVARMRRCFIQASLSGERPGALELTR